MRLAIASGKGGTGKTTVAVSLALSLATANAASAPLFLDCDVEEPNAALFLRPEITAQHDVGLLIPVVDMDRCTACGRCAEVCEYHAITVIGKQVLVFPELCHGCGSCMRQCPEVAIHETLNLVGTLEEGIAGTVEFFQGTLNVGEATAVPVIRQLKQWAIPPDVGDRPVILDAPPGTSCPVVETMRGADAALLVTEPTPFGLHDLRVAVQVARDELGLPVAVVVNRDGVDAYCATEGLPILLRIPLERVIAEGIARGETLIAIRPEYQTRLVELWKRITELFMKQLVILSGKGGTGKTTVTAALAHLAAQDRRIVLADADVDAANLGLVLAPVTEETHDFTGGRIAVIDPAACIACGRCAEVCRFDAVRPGDTYTVDPIACEGCAACSYECPAEAIEMQSQCAGQWFVATTRYGPLYHAHLFAGQENSGKLVTLVKQMARLRALDDEADLLLVDGPPGIGCPVIATLSGAHLALIVTEPTVSGAHDLERALGLAAHFNIPATVLLNKADLSPMQAETISAYCAAQDIPLVGHLPYDSTVTEAMVRGEPVTAGNGPVSAALHEAWTCLRQQIFDSA